MPLDLSFSSFVIREWTIETNSLCGAGLVDVGA